MEQMIITYTHDNYGKHTNVKDEHGFSRFTGHLSQPEIDLQLKRYRDKFK